MSLRHWEAVRDAIRTDLGAHFGDRDLEGAPSVAQLDSLSGTLATTAIEAYTKSVYPVLPHPSEWQVP